MSSKDISLQKGTQVKESDGIRCVGIRRNLSVGFDQPLLIISSCNKLLSGPILEAGQNHR
jgi:hypothetical protein